MRWIGSAIVAMLVLASGSGGALQAQTPEDLLRRGNAAYEQGRYEDALEAYRGVLQYDVRDPVVDYNLANAEFRVGNLGRAILHYERARRLAPTDPDIQANLEFALAQRFDRVETPEVAAVLRWMRDGQDSVGPDLQAWLLVALVWLVCALTSWCFSRPGGWKAVHGWILAVLLVALLLGASSWFVTLERLEGKRIAVVLGEVVEVLAGPGDNNPALFTVHEGLTLEIRAERDEWLQVSLPNGLNGWIARRAVGEV